MYNTLTVSNCYCESLSTMKLAEEHAPLVSKICIITIDSKWHGQRPFLCITRSEQKTLQSSVFRLCSLVLGEVEPPLPLSIVATCVPGHQEDP